MNVQWRKRRGNQQCALRQDGFVVVVILVLVAVLVVLISANAGTLHHLKGRLLLVEKKQQERWAQEGAKIGDR